MDLIRPKIQEYAEKHSSAEPENLVQLSRETNVNYLFPRMLSGHLQGRFLSMISRLVRPARILEIGAYTGYSAICLAEGLIKGGVLYSLELNDENEDIIRKYIAKSGMDDKIRLKFGNALDIIPLLNEKFDIVFLDADKEHYIDYYTLVFDKLNENGIILADNTLWSGKILQKEERDKETRGIRDFNNFVTKDDRVDNVLLTIRDGIMMIIKK